MIDQETYEKIREGKVVILRTSGTEKRILSMKEQLKKLDGAARVNIFFKPNGVEANVWITGLPYDYRSVLLADLLKRNELPFETSDDTS